MTTIIKIGSKCMGDKKQLLCYPTPQKEEYSPIKKGKND
jgi:hypothetical protein